jgi:hypothetical protein
VLIAPLSLVQTFTSMLVVSDSISVARTGDSHLCYKISDRYVGPL